MLRNNSKKSRIYLPPSFVKIGSKLFEQFCKQTVGEDHNLLG